MPFISTFNAASARSRGFKGALGGPSGQQAYTSPGTYTWVAPEGVTRVSAVCIGGGAGGQTREFNAGFAGGGGGLGYKNNITVVPGQSYTIVVGSGGTCQDGLDSSSASAANQGEDSYFADLSSYSVTFNGTSNWVAAAPSAATTLGTDPFTIEGWFYVTATTGSGQVLVEQAVYNESDGNNTGWILYVNNSGVIVFGNATGGTYMSASIPGGWTNKWIHVALVKATADGNIRIYCNGNAIAETGTQVDMSAALTVRPDTPTLFGSHEIQLSGSFFKGHMSNWRIVKGTGLYTGRYIPTRGPVQAVSGTGLLVFQSPTLVDNSGNSIALSTTYGGYSGGSVSISTLAPPLSSVAGGGGRRANSGVSADNLGGVYWGEGGGNGGRAGNQGNGFGACGGGGAGGYSGNGGNGGNGTGDATFGQAGAAGSGGGGGGGGGTGNGSNLAASGSGGGVGILGQGSNGSGGGAGAFWDAGSGTGGSSGTNGTTQGSGGLYGGGGGVYSTGGGGAVRLIWGPGRAFPSSGTADVV